MTDVRIYVASLSDYNDGTLHGDWIDATQGTEEINAAVQAMLSRSSQPNAEEWAIHDFDGFGAVKLEEYESFAVVAGIAHAIDEAGDDGAACAEWISIDTETDRTDGPALLEAFRAHYRGAWESFKEYVMEDIGPMFLGIDGSEQSDQVTRLSAYIDWDSVARDLEADYTVTKNTSQGYGVWVFEDEV